MARLGLAEVGMGEYRMGEKGEGEEERVKDLMRNAANEYEEQNCTLVYEEGVTSLYRSLKGSLSSRCNDNLACLWSCHSLKTSLI